MKKTLHSLLYPLILGIVLTLIAWLNYEQGTWFTGWDNLHSEFNFGMNIHRSLFSVWEEYQGLGLLAGMAHAADLPRQLFLWLVSNIMPASFIRYFFQYLMLFAGAFGTYFTLLYLLQKNEHKELFALVGGLFYVFNLGTIQYFFVQFEPYSTFWGLFPWEIYTLLRFLDKPDKKNFLLLVFINILAIPQAVVQTIFVVYMLIVAMILGVYTWRHKTKEAFLKAVAIGSTILVVNSFWLLPNMYFTAKDVEVTQLAMNNQMNTDRFFEVNKRRGNITDFALLKEFYYDFQEIDQETNEPTFLMAPWRDYHSNPVIPAIGYLFFLVILLGLFKQYKYKPYIIGIFTISALAFLSNTMFFAEANSILRALPLVSQMFRNPFTKFIAPAIFSFSILFVMGLIYISEQLKKKHIYRYISAGFAIFLLAIYAFPVFNGHLFYSYTRIKIPDNYFKLFSYFERQDKNARIMNLPQDSYWGWGTYKWGSVGSGFLWYGIEQPIMDRAFDVWSDELEGYYWELQYALKKEDQELLNAVLAKYDIDYIIFDESYQPSDSMPIKHLLKQEDLLENNELLEKDQTFGTIRVYKRTNALDSNVIWISSLPSVLKDSQFANADIAFQNVGDYITQNSDIASQAYFYPYESLFTNRLPHEHTFAIEENDDSFILTKDIPAGAFNITLPSFAEYEKVIPVELFARRSNNQIEIHVRVVQPQTYLGNTLLNTEQQEFSFDLNSNSEGILVSINNNEVLEAQQLTNELSSIGRSTLINSPIGNTINIYSTDDTTLYNLPPISFGEGYPCVTPNGEYQAEEQKSETGFTLKGNGVPTCISSREKIEFEEDSLIKMSFTYTSGNDEAPIYCVFSDELQDCVNKRNRKEYGFSTESTPYKNFFEYQEAQGDLTLSFTLEPNSTTEKPDNITFERIALTSYPLLSSYSITELQPSQEKQYFVEVNELTTLQTAIAKTPFGSHTKELISGHKFELHHLANNPLFSSDYYATLVEQDNSLRIYAKDTFANFWFNLDEIDTSVSSIISVEAKRLQGFPLMLNILSSSTDKKLLQTQIPVGKNFETNYYIIPPTYEFDTGYQIILNNASYNSRSTVHDIKDMSVYQFPYEYLTNIQIRHKDAPLPGQRIQQSIQAQKKHTGKYIITYPLKPGILMLSQSYHDGWKAFLVNDQSLFSTMLPFFFAEEIQTHISINNWANGWLIDTETAELTNSHSIVLLFWPQYLQYAGYMLVLLIPLFLFLATRTHSR